jgi:Flp pilus assembly protein TadB
MSDLLLILAFLAIVGAVLCSGAVAAWRRERRRCRLRAERLIVEGHIEQLTAQTLQAMRRATREHLRDQR